MASPIARFEPYAYSLLDRGLIPDFILRPVVRHLCRVRKTEIEGDGSFQEKHGRKMEFVERARRKEVAERQEMANEQHYEVPTSFIQACTGPYMKYSSCLYPSSSTTLQEAEILMMESYCRKACLNPDGQKDEEVKLEILDLGCGWGSLGIFLASKYPSSHLTLLSNSSTQKLYIDSVAKEKGLNNLEVFTGDVGEWEWPNGRKFDRILSIEMFEHCKNYHRLLGKVSSWLRDPILPPADVTPVNGSIDSDTNETCSVNGRDEQENEDKPTSWEDNGGGLLFIHIFCHKDMPYDFNPSDGWMAQTFFTGGTMPSHDLLLYSHSSANLTFIQSWYINGKNYSRTLEDWLKKLDASEIGKRFGGGKMGMMNDSGSSGGDEKVKIGDGDKRNSNGNGKAKQLINAAEAKVIRKQEEEDARVRYHRFRTFFIACSEFFGLDNGETWGVGHYLFQKR